MLKNEDETGTIGDGLKLQQLVATYNRLANEVTRDTIKKVVNTCINPGQDPDNYFMENTLARSEFETMGEPISDLIFQEICIRGFPVEDKHIKLMVYRGPRFDIGQMQSTMRDVISDNLSRDDGAKGAIDCRGIAMISGNIDLPQPTVARTGTKRGTATARRRATTAICWSPRQAKECGIF